MTSYFSSITTSLRRAISSSDEIDDPENEDLSHLSNVLRAYYIEKGRRLPPWLPPDKKSPAASTPALVNTTTNGADASLSRAPSRGGGLGDLWGDAPTPPAQPQTSSLRLVRSANPAQNQRLTPSSLKPGPATMPPLHHTKSSGAVMEGTGARPLPSQRLGSYQAAQTGGARTPDRSLSGASAQERLRARLHGRGGGSGSEGYARKPVGGFGR